MSDIPQAAPAVYAIFPTTEPRYSARDPHAEAVVAVAAARGHLKAAIRLNRQVERDRRQSKVDRRRPCRDRHMLSGALALLRAGGRS
jgi:hypothetical protein